MRVVVGRQGPAAPTADDWESWAWLARTDRVAPLLYQLVDTVPTDLTDEQRSDARQLQGSAMLRCVELEHHTLAVSRTLAGHGIRSVVLKGGATAHLDHPDPSWREFSDIDLLLDPDDRRAALAILGSQGWTQGYALPRGHADYYHALTLVRGQVELDLHQRIAHRALGLRIPTDELLARAVPYEVAGTELMALSAPDRLIHAAIHAVTAGPNHLRLSSVADVLVGAERRADRADEVLARAEGWRVRSLVERAVEQAYETAQLDVHPDWVVAMDRPVRQRDRLVDSAYLVAWRRPAVEELAYLRLLGWRDGFRYARGYLSTDPDYAAQHGRTGVRAQARYLLSKLRSSQ